MGVFAEFQLPGLSRSGLKVPSCVVWLRHNLVFSLNLSKAEQLLKNSSFHKSLYYGVQEKENTNLQSSVICTQVEVGLENLSCKQVRKKKINRE